MGLLLNGSGTKRQRTWEWLGLLPLPQPSLIGSAFKPLRFCAQWQSLGEESIALAESSWVPVVQTGYAHVQGTWWNMPWELPSCQLLSVTLEGVWELGDSWWLEGNKWHTYLAPRRAGRRESEELKPSQPKGSWLKLSGNRFRACGWEDDCEQSAWIYGG